MKRTQQILIIMATLLTGSCNESDTLTEKEKIIVVADVRQTLSNYHHAIRQSGLTAEFGYLDSSSGFFWVPPGYTATISYDSVATILRKNAASYKYIDNAFETLRITALTKTLATYSGRLHSTMTDKNNKKETFLLIETGVMIKRTGGWKLLSGQTGILN